MGNVDYHRPLTNSKGSVQFTQVKLSNNDDVSTIFMIFDQYNTKGPIELDTSLVRSFKYIKKSLILSRTYEKIKTLM
jgi:hypothetical protein